MSGNRIKYPSDPDRLRHKKISEDLMATRALTKGPINANYFIFSPVDLPEIPVQESAIKALKNLPIEGEYAMSIPRAPFYPDIQEQLYPVWQHRPEILTFHFGIPPLGVIEKAHSLGVAVGITATNLNEAMEIVKAGADIPNRPKCNLWLL